MAGRFLTWVKVFGCIILPAWLVRRAILIIHEYEPNFAQLHIVFW